MSLSAAVAHAVSRTRGLPTAARYALTLGLVAMMFLLRRLADPVLPMGYPFLVFFVAILVSAALFDHGCGFVAVIVSALLAAWFYLPPIGQPGIDSSGHLLALGLFVGIGAVMALVLESLHRALAEVQAANRALARSERMRTLLLREFRHRTRNDLGSLAGLLHLRARTAPSEAVREGLREAAQHAMALARVHTRLAAAELDVAASVDSREFVLGLCADLEATALGEGLRPVALIAEAEPHPLDTERAVQLGLVLNETVTNALKYGFPEGRAGSVRVRFQREAEAFRLVVVDDGIGLPPEGDMRADPPAPTPLGSGLGTRLLRALAAQLRGSFSRGPGPEGVGTCAELRFPVVQPGAMPLRAGRRA